MQLTLLKGKIHRATVTHSELNYEGSVAIDETLLRAAGIRESEQVHVWDVNNGARFVTYAIRADAGTGIISLNGGAARQVAVGDLVIIAAFASMTAQSTHLDSAGVKSRGESRVRLPQPTCSRSNRPT